MTSRVLGWAFTILSVTIIWQVRLDSSLQKFAKSLGAEPGSLIDRAFVDLGVPLVLSVFLLVLNWFYGRVWWRVLHLRTYLHGWWVYSLLAETPDGLKETLGYFHVQHSQEDVAIDEGQAFWLLDRLVLRGDWRSETVWIRDKAVKLVYTMESDKIVEGLPTDYQGYMELSRSKRKPLLGTQVWAGSFNDLKHRGTIRGPVYAERLAVFSRLDIDRLKDLLANNREALLNRVRESWPEFAGQASAPNKSLDARRKSRMKDEGGRMN